MLFLTIYTNMPSRFCLDLLIYVLHRAFIWLLLHDSFYFGTPLLRSLVPGRF